jgi:hypothetical protein
VGSGGAGRALCESSPMVQTNTESIRLWSCRVQWPFSQSTVSKVRQSMAGLRDGFRSEFEYLTSAGLQKYLVSLSNDEVVLTYHVSSVKAQVWVASRTGVEQRNIANPH